MSLQELMDQAADGRVGRTAIPVTVDTGGREDVFPGALVTWLHRPRGGYGYVMPIDAKVLSHGQSPSTRVTIEVKLRTSGAKVKRVVQAENLRWRSR